MNFLDQMRIYHDKYLEKLSKQVSDKWGINQEEILKLWEGCPVMSSPHTGCSYKFSRGQKKNTLCNAAIVENGLCKKHKKKKPRLVMRKHKVFTEYFYHKETKFLLKTKKEGVIGKLDEAEENILPLDSKDIERCHALSLKVKTNQ